MGFVSYERLQTYVTALLRQIFNSHACTDDLILFQVDLDAADADDQYEETC